MTTSITQHHNISLPTVSIFIPTSLKPIAYTHHKKGIVDVTDLADIELLQEFVY